MGQSNQTIKSRLFGPHTKSMNASEYELLSSLLQYNNIIMPLFNMYSQGDIRTSIEQVPIQTNARVDDAFRDGYIIPFDLVNLHLPRKGYAALKHIARPDLFYVKDNIVRPVDVKNSVLSDGNLSQISADSMTHIFSHNDYFSQAIQEISKVTNISLDDLVFEDGFSLSAIAAQEADSIWDFLDKNDDKTEISSCIDSSGCSSKEAKALFDIFLNEEVKYAGSVSSLSMQKAVGDVHTLIHNVGASPYSVLVVDGFDEDLNPAFRFSYLRNLDNPISVFPTDITLARQVRDEYVKNFYSNPKEVDEKLEKLLLPARLRHEKDAIKDSIERKKHRIISIGKMISLYNHNSKSELRVAHNAKNLSKIGKLKKEILVKKDELKALNEAYHKSSQEFEKQKDLYAKHNKLAWENHFGKLFEESFSYFEDEIAKKGEKYAARKIKAGQLNEKFSVYTSNSDFSINRSPRLAKLYLSLDRGETYHSFSLSEKRLLSSSK